MTISITRVYTRTGDGGETVAGRRPAGPQGLAAHRRLRRRRRAQRGRGAGPRLQRGAAGGGGPAERHRWLDEVLKKVQNQLFDLGSELATPPDAVYEGMFRMGEGEVTELEHLMDDCQKDLEPLKSFILPGGGRVHGFLHQARTVCRRAERELLALSRVEPVAEWTLRYLNRLSDLFFVLGRWVGKHMGEQRVSVGARVVGARAAPQRDRRRVIIAADRAIDVRVQRRI